MQISLQQVVPIPIKDKIVQRNSDVWNTSVTFSAAEKIKIKAPSGTGKTTLTHYLYKIRNDYEGYIQWNGENVHKLSQQKIADIRQYNLSIIFQDLRLFPQLTAFDNIELKRIMQKPYYTQDKIYTMAERLGVHTILQQKAGICSYGEQQRIAIIRALIQPFSLLLMDEPFSHLDHANATIAAQLIEEECNNRNAGFVLTDLDDDTFFNYTQKLML